MPDAIARFEASIARITEADALRNAEADAREKINAILAELAAKAGTAPRDLNIARDSIQQTLSDLTYDAQRQFARDEEARSIRIARAEERDMRLSSPVVL